MSTSNKTIFKFILLITFLCKGELETIQLKELLETRVVCPTFTCGDEGKVAVPQKSIMTFLGCSGLTQKGYASITSPVEPIDNCCNRRETCLSICGISRAVCDRDFETCSNDACNAKNSEKDIEECFSGAYFNILKAAFVPCNDFYKLQEKSCDCILSDDLDQVTAKREAFLMTLYPNKEANNFKKVKILVQKANSSSKFAALVYKLFKMNPKLAYNLKSDEIKRLEKMVGFTIEIE